MKQSLQLRIGQSLKMTPQLQQAIKLLQLSSLELQAEIQQTLDANPLLDQDDNFGEITVLDLDNSREREDATDFGSGDEAGISDDRAEQQLPDDLAIDASWENIFDNQGGASGASTQQSTDSHDLFENQAGAEDTLKNHLVWQLDCSHLSALDHDIGLAIIDAIDDRGYLTESIAEIHASLARQYESLELDEVAAVQHLVQRFDPVGVGASSPSECMKIQLGQYDPHTPHLAKAMVLVDKYLEHLASNDVALLKRRLQASESELREIIRLIQTTNPHPGHSISQNHAEYVVPDVYVSKQSGRWRVSINPEHAPRLRVNDQYASLIKRSDSSDQNTYLKDHLQEARWFIKSLQSRNETLLRVASSIVERQHAFLEYGDEAMQPMVLRDIAELLEMHESTVSRVTSHKYMHTPRGIFEFRYFFSSHVATADGGECSATAIRAIIRKLIAGENREKPLSDSKITKLLDDQGINVARRTVAKYREALNIPPSNERKRLF
jgi:RNA polymerase sigma-54 factor